MPKSILDILTAKNVLNAGDLPAIRQEAKEKNVGLEDVLYARGINERDVAEAKSELTGYPVKYLAGAPVRFEVLHEIPEESARHYKMIPLGKDEGYFDVGMLVPEEVTAQGHSVSSRRGSISLCVYSLSRLRISARSFRNTKG